MPGSKLQVWDHESGDYIRTLKGHTHTVTDLSFTPKGSHLASLSPSLSRKSAIGSISNAGDLFAVAFATPDSGMNVANLIPENGGDETTQLSDNLVHNHIDSSSELMGMGYQTIIISIPSM